MPDEYFCHFYFVIETAYASPGFYGLYPINNWSNSSARAATQLEITITPCSWSKKLNACLRKKSHIHPLSLVSPNHQWYQKNAFLKAVKSWQRFKCNKTSVWIFKGKNEWGLSKKCCNVNLFNGLAYHNVDENVFEKKIFEKDIKCCGSLWDVHDRINTESRLTLSYFLMRDYREMSNSLCTGVETSNKRR